MSFVLIELNFSRKLNLYYPFILLPQLFSIFILVLAHKPTSLYLLFMIYFAFRIKSVYVEET